MALTDMTIIRRSMTARLFSTLTTILTVAVAVALMLVLLTMRDAGEKAFERGSGNMHILVSRDSSPMVSVLNGVFYANAPARPIAWREYEKLAAELPLEFAIPIQLGDSYRGLPVLATTPEFFSQFKPDPQVGWSLAQGRYFEKELEIVVGAAAARSSGLAIGDTIFVTHGVPRAAALGGEQPAAAEPHVHKEFPFKVVGILNPTGSAHDRALFMNLDSSWIMHAFDRMLVEDPRAPVPTVADLDERDRLITGIYLRVLTRPGQDASAALPQVYSMLRSDPSITAASPTDQIRQLFTIVSNIDQLFVAMAAVVMVSSGIAIMLALYNSMEQRRRQIAVLRVLGCSQGRIFGLVVTESAILGMLGAAAGVLAAFAGSTLVAGIMKQRLGLVIEPALPLELTLLVILATIALAAAAGIVPAAMAYRTPVVRNLRPIG
ncbi:MAG: FtsX-like permease family protein [Planctomycetota bacterium]|nr:FtsX-like permease family protein [Planctomycetota bacterium]